MLIKLALEANLTKTLLSAAGSQQTYTMNVANTLMGFWGQVQP
jgi:hypothetical protein